MRIINCTYARTYLNLILCSRYVLHCIAIASYTIDTMMRIIIIIFILPRRLPQRLLSPPIRYVYRLILSAMAPIG